MPSARRALTLLLPLAAPLTAQSVEGVASTRGVPVGYALVLLVDSTGREIGSTLSDGDGHFAVSAPAPGSHRVAVRRIGHRAWISEPLVLGGGVQPLALDLPEDPIVLPDLRPEATGRCRVRPALGAGTTALLDAARTGLGVAEATTRLGRIRVAGEARVRLLDPSLVSVSEDRSTIAGRVDWPLATLPPDSVALAGFVGPVENGTRDYFGPDARLFAASWFLDTHCFDLVLPEPPGDTLVAVSFQPERSSPRPDVRGTLWLDRRTLGFLRLDFRWTGLGAWVPGEAAGGDLSFLPLPGGGLLLREWWVRIPLADYLTRDPRLVGFLEAGGRVTEVLGTTPAP